MNRDVRDRLVLPFAVPLGLFALIGVLVWSFSRILLAVERETAVAIALAAAVDIIVIATLVAGRKPDRRSYHVPLLALSAIAVIGGGVLAAGKERGPEAAEESREGPAKPAAFTIAAKNVAFDKTTIPLAADRENVIHFVNDDAGVPHNVSIFRDAGMTDSLFKGELITGPKTIDYRVKPLPAGTYHFHCDVHPNMQGTVEVAAGAAAPPGEMAARPVKVTAKNVAFDMTELTFAAGQQAVIDFRNDDAGVPHNVAIYRDEQAGQVIFKGELVTGPKSIKYTFASPPAGSYFFRCDVHPTMKGTVTVR
jgi:plastocyanin